MPSWSLFSGASSSRTNDGGFLSDGNKPWCSIWRVGAEAPEPKAGRLFVQMAGAQGSKILGQSHWRIHLVVQKAQHTDPVARKLAEKHIVTFVVV